MNLPLPLLAVTVCLFVGAGCATPDPERPNILFIMSDDHAFQAISAYDSSLIRTPNIDRLAREGMLFERGFVTNSICGPSRAALLTGKFSHVNGFHGNSDRFDPDQETFPKLLRADGYQTALIGKWHLGSDPQGFDFWRILPGQGWYYNPDFIEMDGQKKQYRGYVTDLITDFALDWLREEREDDRPFCLFYQHKAPHREWMPSSEDFDRFDDRQFSLPPTFYDNYAGRRGAGAAEMEVREHMNLTGDTKLSPEAATGYPGNDPYGVRQYTKEMSRMTDEQRAAWLTEYGPVEEDFLGRFQPTTETSDSLAEWKFQRYLTDYLRCIAAMDRNVGRVLDYLDREGLAENTIVVYTSDQGFFLGEHGWFDKRWMYEQSFRTPMLVRFPREVAAGSRSEALVQNIDFAPTLLDYARIPIPDAMQGESLRPVLKGERPAVRDALYYHYYGFPAIHRVKRHYGIRTDRYKLIHLYNDIDAWELYDLERDPHEINNLIDDPTYAEVETGLREQLSELREQYRVPEEDGFVSREGSGNVKAGRQH
jgi:arylsulfatase A-like enzyme